MKSKIIALSVLLVILAGCVATIAIINRFSASEEIKDPVESHTDPSFIDWSFSEDQVLYMANTILDFKAENGYLIATEQNGGYNYGYYYIPISLKQNDTAFSLKDYKYVIFEFDYSIGTFDWVTTSHLNVGFNNVADIVHTVGKLRLESDVIYTDTDRAENVQGIVNGSRGQYHCPDEFIADDAPEGTYGFMHCRAIMDVVEGSITWCVEDEVVGKWENVISSEDTIYNVVFYLEKGFLDSELVLDNVRAEGIYHTFTGSIEDLYIK